MATGKLTEKQELFVSHFIGGNTQTKSAEMAGYSAPGVDGTRLVRTPSVIDAIRRRVDGAMQTDGVVIGFAVLREIALDKTTPPSTRVQAAKIMLDKGGIGENTNDNKGLLDKPLHERTVEELQAVVDQARITLQNTPPLLDVTPEKIIETKT